MKSNSLAKNAEVETSSERHENYSLFEYHSLCFAVLEPVVRRRLRLEDGGEPSCARKLEKVHET